MKVICINSEHALRLTIGKEYDCDIIYARDSRIKILYKIKDDIGYIGCAPSYYFITLEEHRDKKLKELGI
jgi:hypothetical protein